MPKVFISYGRDESHGQNLATETQNQLQAAGFEVFRDVIGLKPGDVWYSKLEFELESSDIVVLVISEKVRKSKWVHNEISMAEEIGLPVIPVFAEAVRSPLWLRHLQALDFSEQTNWPQLISAIKGHTGTAAIKQAVSGQKPKTKPTPVVGEDKSPDSKSREPLLNPQWSSNSGKDQYGQYADLQMNNVTQRFRLINPGTFWMGSPEAEAGRYDDEILHEVTLSKSFWFGDTTVTQALWLEILDSNPSSFVTDMNRPVVQVNWYELQELIKALNNRVHGLNALLPTEARWEYACRAGTSTPFSFGHDVNPLQVNYDSSESDRSEEKELDRATVVPVKTLPINPWGLFEMHGNVLEWCSDGWQENLGTSDVKDPAGPGLKKDRVLRGGSWYAGAKHARSACRASSTPRYKDTHVSCRLVVPAV